MHSSGASCVGAAPRGLGAIERLVLTVASFVWAGWTISAGPVVEWTRLHPFPSAAQARTLMHDGQVFVALCDGGVILHHAATGSWKRAATPTTNELRSGLFAMGRFVAAGDGGTIVTSDDGLVWESQTTGTSADLVAVADAGSSLLALGEGGALLRSTDGLAWSIQAAPTSRTLRAAAYGAGTYVAVGDAGTVLTSSDGTLWTLRANVTQDNLEDVVFGNGVFMARGSKWVVVSTDGVQWAAQQPQGPDADIAILFTLRHTLRGLAFGHGLFALCGDTVRQDLGPFNPAYCKTYTLRILLVSADGTEWHNLVDVSPFEPDGTVLGKMAFGNGVFVALDPRGFFRSDNGLDWALVRGLASAHLRFESGRFLAVEPVSANPTTPNRIFTSQDGATWEELARDPAPDPMRDLYEVVFGNERFVIAGSGVNLVSTDGRSWSWRFHSTDIDPHGIVSHNGVFVALSPAGTLLASTDGLEWSAVATAPEGNFAKVRFLGQQYIAVGSGGALATSPDGSNWTRRESGTASDLVDLATDGSQVVVVGAAGTLLRSTDGAVWHSLAPVTTENLSDIAWGNNRWMVLGPRPKGPILRSNDGVSWSVELLQPPGRSCPPPPQPPAWGPYPPLRFEGGTFCAHFRYCGMPLNLLLRSADGIDWGSEPGGSYGNEIEIGLADFVAQSHLTVTVWLPGWIQQWPRGSDWVKPSINVISWSDLGTDTDSRFFYFDQELRSIAFGRNRFITVGEAGAIYVSNTIGPAAPVLAIGVDQASRRLRLEITGLPGRQMRLEFSADLANWIQVGTYSNADSPLWFDLASEPGGASGYYRAMTEPGQ